MRTHDLVRVAALEVVFWASAAGVRRRLRVRAALGRRGGWRVRMGWSRRGVRVGRARTSGRCKAKQSKGKDESSRETKKHGWMEVKLERELFVGAVGFGLRVGCK